MTTAIIYATKYGTTEYVAQRIAQGLSEDTQLFSIRDGVPSLDEYDTLVLGTAIYAGQPMKQMTKFIKSLDYSSKRVALFVCGMETNPDKRNQELVAAYPQDLRNHATVSGFLGGQFQFSRMNRAERFIIHRIAQALEDSNQIDEAAIQEFITALS